LEVTGCVDALPGDLLAAAALWWLAVELAPAHPASVAATAATAVAMSAGEMLRDGSVRLFAMATGVAAENETTMKAAADYDRR